MLYGWLIREQSKNDLKEKKGGLWVGVYALSARVLTAGRYKQNMPGARRRVVVWYVEPVRSSIDGRLHERWHQVHSTAGAGTS